MPTYEMIARRDIHIETPERDDDDNAVIKTIPDDTVVGTVKLPEHLNLCQLADLVRSGAVSDQPAPSEHPKVTPKKSAEKRKPKRRRSAKKSAKPPDAAKPSPSTGATE